MKRFLHLDLLFLILSAIGALTLSASNTFAIMRSTGDVIAFASVFTLELGLAGLILALEPERSTHWVWKFWSKVKLSAPAILIVVMLMVTNLLNNVGVLGIAVGERFKQIVQLVVLGGFIPPLALTTLHAAKDRWQYYKNLEKEVVFVKRLKKTHRVQHIADMLRKKEPVHVDELATMWGISSATLAKDYQEAAKILQQEF